LARSIKTAQKQSDMFQVGFFEDEWLFLDYLTI